MAIRKIILRGDPNVSEEFKAAVGTIKPGMLLELDSNGEVILHANATDTNSRLLALERGERGDTITTLYPDNDQVKVAFMRSGDVYAMIGLSGEALEPGDFVDSDGAGRVKLVDTDTATDDTQRGAIIGSILDSHGTLGADTLVRILAN